MSSIEEAFSPLSLLKKTCSKCHEEKELERFPVRKKWGKLGRGPWCKDCGYLYLKEYQKKNKEELSRKAKDKYWANPEAMRAKNHANLDRRRAWTKTNWGRIQQQNKEYAEANKNKSALLSKKWYEAHKVEKNAKLREDRKLHPEKYKEIERKRHVNMSLARKISSNLRGRFYHALKNGLKGGSAVRDLGCSIEEFKTKHIEDLFWPGMGWDNWSKKGWHIDHIIPLDLFDLTKAEEVKIACHYTNIQPLWDDDNFNKNARLDWLPTESRRELPGWVGNDSEGYKQRAKAVLDRLDTARSVGPFEIGNIGNVGTETTVQLEASI